MQLAKQQGPRRPGYTHTKKERAQKMAIVHSFYYNTEKGSRKMMQHSRESPEKRLDREYRTDHTDVTIPIEDVLPHDVLLGRGMQYMQHPGNRRFYEGTSFVSHAAVRRLSDVD